MCVCIWVKVHFIGPRRKSYCFHRKKNYCYVVVVVVVVATAAVSVSVVAVDVEKNQ